MDGSDPVRIEQGDWPSKVVVVDKCMLGFPTSKAHYQVDVHWTAGRSPEGDEWADAVHSFWCRWSHAESLAKDVQAIVDETSRDAKAKGFAPPAPLNFSLASKWWGDRGDVKEITKRMGEMGNYLAALRDWGAGLERDTTLWDRVRLMGPVKVFLCQKNTTGHPTGGATVTDVMFGSASLAPAPAPRPKVFAKPSAYSSDSSAVKTPPTPMDRAPGTRSGAPQLRVVTATYLFKSIKAVPQDVYSLDITTDTDLVESTTVVVDEDLLLYKNAGPNTAPADSVAAQIYQWVGIAASSFPQEVLASVLQPGDAKYYVYGTGLHMIHVGSPDFRSAAHAACSQNKAEALLAEVYSAIFRQFLIAVSGLADSSTHKLRMPAVANGDCAGRFAAELDVMTYSAINLALSQLSSAERARLAFQGVEIVVCVGTDRTELERFEAAGFTVEAEHAAAAAAPAPVPVDESVEASAGVAAAAVDTSVEAAAQVSSSVDDAAMTSVAAAREAAAVSSTQHGAEAAAEAAATAALGVDASVEVDSSVAAEFAKAQEDEGDDDALLARMLGAPLSHGNEDDDALGLDGGAIGAMSISVAAPVDEAVEEEDWIE